MVMQAWRRVLGSPRLGGGMLSLIQVRHPQRLEADAWGTVLLEGIWSIASALQSQGQLGRPLYPSLTSWRIRGSGLGQSVFAEADENTKDSPGLAGGWGGHIPSLAGPHPSDG